MKAIIIGYGKMGKLIEKILEDSGHRVLATYCDMDISQLALQEEKADVVIDFSSPLALDHTASYIKRTGAALVSGTTGLSSAQVKSIKELASYAPVMYSANYSFGIAVFKKTLQAVSHTLMANNFDVEIVEAHHNQKIDAPSGTAKALLAVVDPADTSAKVYGRSGLCGKRGDGEIGVHAIRGGTVAGEHRVMFLGEDEKFEIRHSAISRKIFAVGAVKAAEKIWQMDNGFYEFDEIMVE